MAVIKCKMCGGTLATIPDSTVAECEYCGSIQTIPQQDDEKKLTLFARANRLRAACEFDKAAGVFETIVADFPEEAESYWGLVLCKYGIEYVDDPATGRKIPTCHRSSFDSIMDDSDFGQAMENADTLARRVYREEANQIEEIRKGIIAVSANEQPYDIFICYKETDENGDRTLDSVLAQDIYDALTEKGYRVFFSRITLEDKLGVEYEPYIFAALNSARIMLAVGTDYEYYNAVWVKNEWSRYLKLMTADKSKHLIPCFKGIDAYDMPREFAKLQAQDLGKVGAMQDLLRGVDKLLGRKPQIIKKNVTLQQTVNPTVDSFLQRAFICLEDGDWKDAQKCCEQVLNVDPKNVKAYLCMLMADMKVTRQEDLRNCKVSFAENSSYKKLIRFADDALRETISRYLQHAVEESYDTEYAEQISQFQKNAVVADGELTAYNGTEEHVFIPRSITSIGKDAFKKNLRLRSVTIPNSVTHIDPAAFRSNRFLKEIILFGENKKYRMQNGCLIDQGKKKVVFGLEDAEIPGDGSVVSIGSSAFEESLSMKTITIPKGITKIGDRAFCFCFNLSKVTLPDSLTSIGESAFTRCPLVTLTLPKSITSIPKNAFDSCEALTKVSFPEGLTEIGDGAFWDCSSLANITFPKRLAAIGESAFSGCSSLTAVTFPDSLIRIGDYAFDNCAALTSVVFSSGIQHIGTAAFAGCSNLSNLVLPSANGKYRFTNGCLIDTDKKEVICSSSDAVIPSDSSVTGIGDHAFDSCNHLTEIIIPDNITTIGEFAFSDCESAESIYIPDSVVQIGTGAFSGCKQVRKIRVSAGNKQYRVTDGCLINVAEKKVLFGCIDAQIPRDGSVERIEAWAFWGCASFTTVAVPEGISSIGPSAFSCCSSLTAVTLPKSLVRMEESAFFGCKALVSITIPSIHTSMGDYVFESCESLKTICAPKESQAAAWAKENNIAWEDWDERVAREEMTRKLPVIRERIQSVRNQLASGLYYALGLKSDGRVVSAGLNPEASETVNSWTDIVSVSTGIFHAVGLKSDGTVVATKYTGKPEFYYGQCDVTRWRDIVAVSAGTNHTVGLKKDGTVVATKFPKESLTSHHGQCDVDDWSDIKRIAAGVYYTLGVKSDGTVVAAGVENKIRWETDTWTDIVDICVGYYHVAGLKSDGTVVAAGRNNSGECNVKNWTNIVAISAGANHTVGLKSDGTVVATDFSRSYTEYRGQCAVSSWTDIVAISAKYDHTLGLKSDGTVVITPNLGYDERDRSYSQIDSWKLFQSIDTLEEEKAAHRKKQEEERKAAEAERQRRQSLKLCQHCGGEFKGLFSKKCASCGKPKDY